MGFTDLKYKLECRVPENELYENWEEEDGKRAVMDLYYQID